MKKGLSKRREKFLWDLGYNLANEIHKYLVDFKEVKRIGYPARFSKNPKKGESQEDSFNRGVASWEKELDKMIEGWRLLSTQDDFITETITEAYDKATGKKKYSELLKEERREMTKKERAELYRKIDEREKKGKELAKKLIDNIFSLWD